MTPAPGGPTRIAARSKPDRSRARRRKLPVRTAEERLAQGAGRGDAEAFTAIFRRYEPELFRFCLGIVGEPQDADDAIQNTMVKVLQALPGEQREIQLKPWLYRIAHNEAVEIRRRAHRHDPLQPAFLDPGSSPEERTERREQMGILFGDISDLPERQRAALVMRELSGLEFGEIGDALATSPGAVRQALYEARRGLQQMEIGRDMACETVVRTLSEGDGRRHDGRAVRAHLRSCTECRCLALEIRDRGETGGDVDSEQIRIDGSQPRALLSSPTFAVGR